jgi:hypothetical protein
VAQTTRRVKNVSTMLFLIELFLFMLGLSLGACGLAARAADDQEATSTRSLEAYPPSEGSRTTLPPSYASLRPPTTASVRLRVLAARETATSCRAFEKLDYRQLSHLSSSPAYVVLLGFAKQESIEKAAGSSLAGPRRVGES